MANSSLNCPTSTLEPTPCDSLVTSLEKAKALLEVATFEHFPNCTEATIYHYMCTLSETIEQALQASNVLCKRDLKRSKVDIKD